MRRADLPPVTVSELAGVRYLHLGSIWVQGAMRVAKPDRIELEYVQRTLACLLWLPSAELGQGHAVQLGLGSGTVTRFARNKLRMTTTAVEINPLVVSACRAWFRLPEEDERLRIVLADAGAWLRSAAPASVRLLHVDLYDQEAAAPVLDSEDFYADCRRVLEDGGVMSVNLFGRDASYERSAARIAAAFGAEQVWSVQPTSEGNTAVIAARGVVVPGRDELEARAATIESRFAECALPARRWLRMVRPYAA